MNASKMTEIRNVQLVYIYRSQNKVEGWMRVVYESGLIVIQKKPEHNRNDPTNIDVFLVSLHHR